MWTAAAILVASLAPLAPAAQTALGGGSSPAPQAPLGGGSLVTPEPVRARIEAAPDHARVGEPITLTFVVEHPDGARVVLPAHEALPRSLAFLDELGLKRTDDPSAAGRKITRSSWRVMALEGGTLALPPLEIVVEDGARKSALQAALPALEIESALLPGEDAPRPAKGFRPAPEVRSLTLRALIAGVLVIGLVVAASIAWAIVRGRRRVPAGAQATPLERLEAIDRRAREEPESVHDVTYMLTRLVRDAVDAHAGAQRAALTDDDWSSAVTADERVPAGARAAAARVLDAAERVKYAQETPSPLAVREWMEEARAVLRALETGERRAA